MTIEITDRAAGVIVACRDHVMQVHATYGSAVSGKTAESLILSLGAVFGLVRNQGGHIGATDEMTLSVTTPHLYAEMIPHRVTAGEFDKLVGSEVAAELLERFIHPVQWSVHS